jgi:hypothetical protein
MPRLLVMMVLLSAPALLGGESLLRPMSGPGAGDVVEGLRASVTVMKPDFGPGESLMVTFKLINESDKPVVVKLGKNHVYDFSMDVRRNGRDVSIKRVEFNDFFSPNVTVQPNETATKLLDLREIHMTEAKWAEDKGNYEVRLTYLPKNMKTGWAKFSITEPGENPPALEPEVAEQVRTLIARLGDDDAGARDKAYAELLSLGNKVLRPLEEVANTNVGDVATRCKRLIEEIKKRNAPPPPQPVIIKPRPRPQPVPQPNPLPDPPPDEF